MQQRTVVDGDHGHNLQIVVLAGNGGKRRTGAQHHTLLIGAVHMDHTGSGRIDVIVIGTGVQGVDLGLNVVHIALCTGDVLRDGLHGGVVQCFQFALALLHQGLDL